MDENELQTLKKNAYKQLAEAEIAMHKYACACDVGDEREKTFDVYENIRRAVTVRPANPLFS
tara:strand:+ start:238 stop:423 length:186 start_codon:yes stop_codon:yes gene_type:complete